ncbi:amidohydrolase [Woodsholea maritima]|uniref:amidohydrolase n=1 Tax=Woodsholea maritima TaxID=240237 RepID=UPI00037B595C|nr:amidohydrolase [Woodsholea maritima]
MGVRLGGLSALALACLMGCSPAPSSSATPAREAEVQASNTPAPMGDVIPASELYAGGTIYTGLPGGAQVEAVGVRQGRIVFTGTREAARAITGPETQEIDLAGAVMFPGFTDSHAHILGIGQRERTLNLESVGSVIELQEALQSWADLNREGVITGRGWIETHWPEARFPTRDDLDAIVPERAVILVRADGHALVANSAAMAMVGIDDATPDPDGGAILRDEAGRASGMFVDAAMYPLMALAQAPEGDVRAELYALGTHKMAMYGWTGVHDMSVPYADVAMAEGLATEGRLSTRVYISANGGDYQSVVDELSSRQSGDLVTARAVKVYVDGALGSRGAALLEPYSDAPGTRGLILMQEDEAKALFERALRDGVQMAVHAIGDRGNRWVLDWMEAAFAAVPVEERAVAEPRWRIEHAQILTMDDLNRFAALGVIASMQPSHAIGDLHFAKDRLGEARLQGAYAWHDLVESGAHVTGGSDAPVERGEARIEFYAAVARRDLEGFSDAHWHLEQRLSREAALYLFTQAPAYASFREDELGTIEVGKRADFSVFDTDLMTAPEDDLKHARPVMTIVGGQRVWRAD